VIDGDCRDRLGHGRPVGGHGQVEQSIPEIVRQLIDEAAQALERRSG
jgi:hypothetical protein